MTYPKGSEKQLTPHFKAREFDCPCHCCKTTRVDPELVERLEAFRERVGKPVRVTSGYRCKAHQDELRGHGFETAVGVSQHELGRAADLWSDGLSGVEMEKHARAVGFKAVGVGRTFIHVDTRLDKPNRRWTYS